MDICLVTAFLDIGRQNWTAFRRSIQQYINNFLPYLKLNHDMIVFMDDRYMDVMQRLCAPADHIRLIPINRDWLQKHIHAYQYVDREKEIMESKAFQSVIAHRKHHPECCNPEYTIIQHCKIDFVAHVIEEHMSDAEYYAWTDFGYFQHPSRIPYRRLNVDMFDLNKINFQGIYPLTPEDTSIGYTLTKAPERIGGFFYLGSAKLLLEYQKLYHQVCADFRKINIADDDQHIMIQCVTRNPELFKVWVMGGWHLTYIHFQQSSD